LLHASWASRGADVVAGAAPGVANVEKMTPLYQIESASTTARVSTAKENPVISVPSRCFLYSSGESNAFAAAQRGPKTGDSPVQKAAWAVDKRANNRWTTSRESVDGAGHKRWIN
jgi:hypothetical protein